MIDAVRYAAAIPFVLGEALCQRALDALLGPKDDFHPAFATNSDLDRG